ncbi:hypothetical protein A2230_03695 [candidate division WOR-1 bacterium RIFOXYA2_FULL_36_21]|uniref:Protein kinase domain-containing protein n=1 Tax=candidate division WOR-1 bacterium RIFOXYB2_FULL_36_35 TaxID=1802578 RepID=A0A1F4S223_UNCSA|nr:MAG: hypothetical protein A2230_03695 [candidate division WOR-1 bacterium RIFOXYA2_FULL_36_21]OGC14429.1 MAG: hypothetical protein A2290_08390 [candidate division WOR-1 bacterium RIFOXYB2_FULL_36_35]OGC19949.1 MAG: hypothetical protein A2282_01715 [candidate division WOR-1 bacterium RIFOXYA12_FULL_36_13]
MERLLKSKFKTGKKIGENFFSLTYDGATLSGNQSIIIKIYKRGTLNSPLIKTMKQKVKILQTEIHPRIVKLLDGDYGWQGFYYVRPFIKGVPLKDLIKNKTIKPDEAEGYIVQICEALEATHKRGIIHGALSENNVLIDEKGVKLTDFVIEGDIKESPSQKAMAIIENEETLSPEELSGCRASFSSDIFATGILLYKMLLFKSPFQKQIQKLKGNVELHSDLTKYQKDIIKKALEPDPRLRFKNISELSQSIKNKNVIDNTVESDYFQIELENVPNPKEIEVREIKKETEKSFFMAKIVLLAALAGIVYAVLSSLLGGR